MSNLLPAEPQAGRLLDSSKASVAGRLIPQWIEEPIHFEPHRPRLAFRTVWISDTHLGTSGCNAEMLLDFLKSIQCDTLYLVGDIIDGWQLRKGWYWPPRHNDVVRCVLKMAKHGTRVVYVPGNHDEVFRDYVGLHFGGVEILPEAIHVTADGRTLLIVHGDEFDGVVLYARWLAFLGDSAYSMLLKLKQPVVIVGWSLGGLFGREYARLYPEGVKAVITLGSPFSGDPRQNNVWHLYERVAGHKVDDPPIPRLTAKPPVPHLAIWSRRDGLIAPRSARGLDHERDAEAEFDCHHMAFAISPSAARSVVREIQTFLRDSG